jgi:hypothetical protein
MECCSFTSTGCFGIYNRNIPASLGTRRKIVIILDGFDEISPDYSRKV